MQHDFSSPVAPLAWAQLALRAFARSTNLLVSGQSFRIVSKHLPSECPHVAQLYRLLNNFGAHVSVCLASDTQDVPDVHATFVVAPAGPAAQEIAHELSGIRVLAPLQGKALVVDPSGSVLVDPYDASVHTSEDSLAVYGGHRIAWARQFMPVTRQAVARLAEEGILSGRRIGLALVLEPKTAVLALELAAAGAQVGVFGHADETREDVVAVLRSQGLRVFAESSADAAREEELAREFLAEQFDVLLDDGSHLIRMAHDPQRAPGALVRMVGAAEETTSGLRPLRQWSFGDVNPQGVPTPGVLQIPVMASNDARSKTLFDNGYGTGQSCLLTILDVVDSQREGYPLWNQHVVVVGYGDVGRGFARFSAALGARVSVVELDPVRELLARMDGFTTGSLMSLCPSAQMLVSATGVRHTISVEALSALPDGAVVAVAGGVDQEVAVDAAVAAGAVWQTQPSRQVDPLLMPSGRCVLVADRGNCINVTAGEGNPIEIMDLSFGVQTASLSELLHRGSGMSAGVHVLPAWADDEVCAAALAAWMPLGEGGAGFSCDGAVSFVSGGDLA